MPFTPFKVDLKGEYSPKNISRRDDSRRHKDSHNLSLHKADRYDQHYHPSNSGNVTKSSTVNKDESDRSVVNKTSDKSYNVTITNSHVHLPSSGLPTTSTGQTSQPIISLSDPPTIGNEPPPPPAVAISLPEVRVSFMSDEMEVWAINTTILAFARENEPMPRAKYICDSFNKQYGESWHCVVGSEFGNFANYQENFYIHLTMANQRVIIFKTPAETNCDDEESLKQIQDSLEEATKTSVEAAKICSDLVEAYRNGMEEICSGPNVDLIVKHEELQNKAIEKFYELMKEFKNEKIQTDFLLFITQKTDEMFSTYDAKNKRNVINALESVEHEGIYCDGCENFINGARFTCLQCEDYDLCSICENKGMHVDHAMLRLHKPIVPFSRDHFKLLEFHRMSKKFFEAIPKDDESSSEDEENPSFRPQTASGVIHIIKRSNRNQ